MQSSRIRPTTSLTSLRRRKVVSRPPINHSIPERQDDVVVQHEINTKTPFLLTYGSARQEGANTNDGDSEEKLQWVDKWRISRFIAA